MATVTASIFVGRGHPNDGGINPSHIILLSENSRPALRLIYLEDKQEEIFVIPTVDNMVEDIYLLIATEVMKQLNPGKKLYTESRKSLYEIFSDDERKKLYEQTKAAIAGLRIKVVFNLLEGCHLLHQMDRIQEYPVEVEVTTTVKNG
jgi:hypothetical protein